MVIMATAATREPLRERLGPGVDLCEPAVGVGAELRELPVERRFDALDLRVALLDFPGDAVDAERRGPYRHLVLLRELVVFGGVKEETNNETRVDIHKNDVWVSSNLGNYRIAPISIKLLKTYSTIMIPIRMES